MKILSRQRGVDARGNVSAGTTVYLFAIIPFARRDLARAILEERSIDIKEDEQPLHLAAK